MTKIIYDLSRLGILDSIEISTSIIPHKGDTVEFSKEILSAVIKNPLIEYFFKRAPRGSSTADYTIINYTDKDAIFDFRELNVEELIDNWGKDDESIEEKEILIDDIEIDCEKPPYISPEPIYNIERVSLIVDEICYLYTSITDVNITIYLKDINDFIFYEEMFTPTEAYARGFKIAKNETDEIYRK
jgi:hypothetical protein